jgi:hypothetical protein
MGLAESLGVGIELLRAELLLRSSTGARWVTFDAHAESNKTRAIANAFEVLW